MTDNFPVPDLGDDSPLRLPRVSTLMRYFRAAAHLSQADLHYYSDVQTSVIADIERGHVQRPQDGTLERLARGFVNKDNRHYIHWLTESQLADMFKEARDNKPANYYVAPELIEINDALLAQPPRARRASLRFLRAVVAELQAMLTTINKPSKHYDDPEAEQGPVEDA